MPGPTYKSIETGKTLNNQHTIETINQIASHKALFTEDHEKFIVLDVNHIEANWKLSQNRQEFDYIKFDNIAGTFMLILYRYPWIDGDKKFIQIMLSMAKYRMICRLLDSVKNTPGADKALDLYDVVAYRKKRWYYYLLNFGSS